ncbi:MAG: AAA family ATPase [Longimicrobiales bacterium]
MSSGRGGEREPVRAALISVDEAFRQKVNNLVVGGKGGIEVGLETDATPADLLREPSTPLKDYDPQLLFLELGSEPEDGIRLAGLLSRSHPGMGILVSGPELSQRQLLDAMRAGVSEVVDRRAGEVELAESLDRVMRKLGLQEEHGARSANGRILAFFSAKGGTGCTTVALNVGIELHRITGKKTLLVDLDLELGEIASFMGVRPRFHLVDLLKNFHRIDDDLLASYIERHESGVHVLSAPFEPETGRNVTAEDISAILAYLRKQYDYVVVDTSKSLAPPALAALRPADLIFLVTNLDICSLRNFKRTLPILRDIAGVEGKRLRLIVNRFKKDTLLSIEDLESTLGLPVHRTLSNDFQSVIESLSTGKPLVLNNASQYTKELKELAAHIAGTSSRGRPGKKPVLKRLFGGAGRTKVKSREALNHA